MGCWGDSEPARAPHPPGIHRDTVMEHNWAISDGGPEGAGEGMGRLMGL